MTNFERVQAFCSSLVLKGDETSGAQFSHCDKYRYSLWRTWTEKGLDGRLCAFIGLNPSTATHEQDDPTIRRCIRFCKDWGFDGYVMLNLFAFRATDPREMKRQYDPIGWHNWNSIRFWCLESYIVCAWGSHGAFRVRGVKIAADLWDCGLTLHHLGMTKNFQPKHPLYLKADTKPMIWMDAA